MIKITAKDDGDNITMSCEMRGTGLEMVEEAFAIITDLPKRLEEANPALLKALRMKFEIEMEGLEEENSDGLN